MTKYTHFDQYYNACLNQCFKAYFNKYNNAYFTFYDNIVCTTGVDYFFVDEIIKANPALVFPKVPEFEEDLEMQIPLEISSQCSYLASFLAEKYVSNRLVIPASCNFLSSTIEETTNKHALHH